jgi:hypothetical protein
VGIDIHAPKARGKLFVSLQNLLDCCIKFVACLQSLDLRLAGQLVSQGLKHSEECYTNQMNTFNMKESELFCDSSLNSKRRTLFSIHSHRER